MIRTAERGWVVVSPGAFSAVVTRSETAEGVYAVRLTRSATRNTAAVSEARPRIMPVTERKLRVRVIVGVQTWTHLTAPA